MKNAFFLKQLKYFLPLVAFSATMPTAVAAAATFPTTAVDALDIIADPKYNLGIILYSRQKYHCYHQNVMAIVVALSRS